jgi:hypothetical protein
MQPTPARTWIAELADQERERRAEQKITRDQALAFVALLTEQIMSDLHEYYGEFPAETPYIETTNEDGASFITRLRDESSNYVGLKCQVRSSVEITQMVVKCSFAHRPSLDKDFKIIIGVDGKLALSDASISDLSRYLLAPVLFDKLQLDGSLESSVAG